MDEQHPQRLSRLGSYFSINPFLAGVSLSITYLLFLFEGEICPETLMSYLRSFCVYVCMYIYMWGGPLGYISFVFPTLNIAS